ncbi:DUF397 domain-containing protein [Streptomyces sp. CRN 30]|nr:DUF397 domain-containing protein [Streptomyces sp. CRN 30]
MAAGLPALVPVRDSKLPHGPVLRFGAGCWSDFISGLRSA